MTNNKQQTAVDIIYQRMSDKIVMQDVNKGLICIHISHDDFIKLAKQAKEMEKQQRISDYYQGACDESDSHGAQYICESDAEKWYNETYGEDKQC